MMRYFDPFGDLESRLRDLEAVSREFGRRIGGPQGRRAAAFLPGVSARSYPLVNVSELEDAFTVQALAPGIAPESLDINVMGNTITISGEKQAPQGVPSEAFHRSERAAGRFVRTVEVPVDVEPENVRADYHDGLLTVRLPKAAAARPRRIQVEMN